LCCLWPMRRSRHRTDSHCTNKIIINFAHIPVVWVPYSCRDRRDLWLSLSQVPRCEEQLNVWHLWCRLCSGIDYRRTAAPRDRRRKNAGSRRNWNPESFLQRSRTRAHQDCDRWTWSFPMGHHVYRSMTWRNWRKKCYIMNWGPRDVLSFVLIHLTWAFLFTWCDIKFHVYILHVYISCTCVCVCVCLLYSF